MIMIVRPALLMLSVAQLPWAFAWGAAGHQIVATIAQIFLTPASRQQLCQILPESAKCHLAPVAAWADTVRNRYTGPLHYVNSNDDWPANHCTFGENGWKDARRNVLVGVVNSTLGVSFLSGEEQDFALRYLVHFMGDLHMPLHLTGRDRGGNEDRVRFDRRITNLHSVWDGRLIAKALRTLTNYTQPLPSRRIESALRGAIYDPYVRFITWEGILGWWKDEWLSWASCPSNAFPFQGIPLDSIFAIPEVEGGGTPSSDDLQSPFSPHMPFSTPWPASMSTVDLPVCPLHWAQPIHDLNCNSTLIWPRFLSDVPPHGTPTPTPPRDLVELDSPWYAGRIRNELVIEKLLAMAGVRLAGVLNELWDPEGVPRITTKNL